MGRRMVETEECDECKKDCSPHLKMENPDDKIRVLMKGATVELIFCCPKCLKKWVGEKL